MSIQLLSQLLVTLQGDTAAGIVANADSIQVNAVGMVLEVASILQQLQTIQAQFTAGVKAGDLVAIDAANQALAAVNAQLVANLPNPVSLATLAP